MDRLTQKQPNGEFLVAADLINQSDQGISGVAIERLARFENAFGDLTSQQQLIAEELVQLKIENKQKTVKFKELLSRKLFNANLLSMLKAHGLE